MYSSVLDFLLGFISVTENAKTDWSNPPGGNIGAAGGFYMRWTKKQCYGVCVALYNIRYIVAAAAAAGVEGFWEIVVCCRCSYFLDGPSSIMSIRRYGSLHIGETISVGMPTGTTLLAQRKSYWIWNDNRLLTNAVTPHI